jgi:AraC-like DNA-binding protein
MIHVREYIDRHYTRPLTVDQLAKLAGLSTYHFIRAFRAHAGQTPHQYLRARRIERARELSLRRRCRLPKSAMPSASRASARSAASSGS